MSPTSLSSISLSSLTVNPVPVTDSGYLTPTDLATCLGCTQSNISMLIKANVLSPTKLPGQGKRYFFPALQFLYYLKRNRYVPHPTCYQAAANSVKRRGWQKCPVTDHVIPHKELGLLPLDYPYPKEYRL